MSNMSDCNTDTDQEPNLLASLTPTNTLECDIAIVHFQLRDLIVCPNKRGELYYVGSEKLMKGTFKSPTKRSKQQLQMTTDFTANCLSFGCGHLALGGSRSDILLYPVNSSQSVASTQVVHKQLRWPATINNSIFLTDSLNERPSDTQDGFQVFVSNNDGTIKVLTLDEKPGSASTPTRTLSKFSEIEIGVCVNHSSLSPDGRTLLSVGDTADVFLHQVMPGGTSFPQIAKYTGGNEGGFSTAWSHDGRKFAVANQDGTVAVWDQRSSHRLATLTTRGTTGDRAPAARVVKFSPPGSPQEVLIFTDETSGMTVADGLSFQTIDRVSIPCGTNAQTGEAKTLQERADRLIELGENRSRVGGGGYVRGSAGWSGMNVVPGTAGCCFSPCGRWVYAATEVGISEWELAAGPGTDGDRGVGTFAF